MARPRLPSRRDHRDHRDQPDQRHPPRTVIKLDRLGLHRIRSQARRELQEQIDTIRNLVGLLDSLSFEIATAEEPEDLRATTTMMRAALREIASTSIETSMAVGKVRFGGDIEGIEIEEAEEG